MEEKAMQRWNTERFEVLGLKDWNNLVTDQSYGVAPGNWRK